MKKLILIFMFLAGAAIISGHSGNTNSKGCHAGKKPYHCHNSGSSATRKTSPSAEKKSSNGKKRNKAYYNQLFCDSVNGKTKVKLNYRYPGGTGNVYVDCMRDEFAYKGGLDKRSSLDNLQQAIFFSHLTGKKPAIVIYDRDGQIGKIEHRIKTAAQRAGVKFISYRK